MKAKYIGNRIMRDGDVKLIPGTVYDLYEGYIEQNKELFELVPYVLPEHDKIESIDGKFEVDPISKPTKAKKATTEIVEENSHAVN